MAEHDPVSVQPEVESEQEKLKYLDILQKATQQAVPYVSKAYDYAKNNSGSLRPSVETIEETIKTVIGPAYDTFHDVPVDALKFADRKVDESVTKALAGSEVKNGGVVETASGLAKSAYTKLEPTGKELIQKYEPVVEQHAASAWQSLNQIPLFRNVAKVVMPTAAYVSEKYNQTVQKTAEEGYQVSSYLPLVPTEKIAKVFKDTEVEADAEPEAEPVVPSGDEGAAVINAHDFDTN